MSEPVLPLVVTPRFMDRLGDTEQYIGRENAARGREFVAALFDFLYDTVGPFPLAFPVYTLPRYPELELRRAVFKRHYNVVYEVTPNEIRCLAFFATSQDAGRLDL
ncbi:MAG: hypothetical protein ACRYG7_37460 [Janthinobacterium lividum]